MVRRLGNACSGILTRTTPSLKEIKTLLVIGGVEQNPGPVDRPITLDDELCVLPIPKDGNCLFASLAQQNWPDEYARAEDQKQWLSERQALVRTSIAECFKKNREYYAPLLETDIRMDTCPGFDEYVDQFDCREENPVWGGETHIHAFVRQYQDTQVIVHNAATNQKLIYPEDEIRPKVFNLVFEGDGHVYGHYDATIRIDDPDNGTMPDTETTEESKENFSKLEKELKGYNDDAASEFLAQALVPPDQRQKAKMIIEVLLPLYDKLPQAWKNKIVAQCLSRRAQGNPEALNAINIMSRLNDSEQMSPKPAPKKAHKDPRPSMPPSQIPPVDHLDGCKSFKDLIDEEVAGVSAFARKFSKEFFEVARYLHQQAPDAFKVVPPAKGAPRDTPRQLAMLGRCQVGKTKITLVLAWLYYHFCGCVSFLGAWRFLSSTKAFKDSINNFNEDLNRNFPNLKSITATVSGQKRTASWYAELYCTEDQRFVANHIHHAQILVLLANVSQITRLSNEMAQIKAMRNLYFQALGRIPIVLLMDEDDDNTQSATRNKYRKERALYKPGEFAHLQEEDDSDESEDENSEDEEDGRVGESEASQQYKDDLKALMALVDTAYHYVSISATHQATFIAGDVDITQRSMQFVMMDLPATYCGFAIPEDSLAKEIPWQDNVAFDNEEGIIQAMVESGCDALMDYRRLHPIQIGGNAVVQLVMPKTAKVAELEIIAESVADYAAIALGKYDRPPPPILVCTLHGKGTARNGDGNKLYVKNLGVSTLLHLLPEDNRVLMDFEVLDDDIENGMAFTLVLPGSKLTAFDIMQLFRIVTAYAETSALSGAYCAIVANYRAGRGVTFKDYEHVLHLTDFFFGKSPTLHHDNYIQAAHRIAGRYPGYTDDRPPPLKFWASMETYEQLILTMKLYDSMIKKASKGTNPLDYIYNYSSDRTAPRLSKPQVRRIYRATYKPGYTWHAGTMSAEASANFDYDSKLEELQKSVETAVDEQMPGIKIANRVQIHQLNGEDADLLSRQFSGKRISLEAQKIIQRLCNLPQAGGIHIIRNPGAYDSLLKRRPRAKGHLKNIDDDTRFHSRACWYMTGPNTVVVILFDLDLINEQCRMYDEEQQHDSEVPIEHEHPPVPLLYWYPKRAPALYDEKLEMFLAIDLPTNYTHRGQVEFLRNDDAPPSNRKRKRDSASMPAASDTSDALQSPGNRARQPRVGQAEQNPLPDVKDFEPTPAPLNVSNGAVIPPFTVWVRHRDHPHRAGLFDYSKFGQKRRPGACILYGDQWMKPTDFVERAGYRSNKFRDILWVHTAGGDEKFKDYFNTLGFDV